MRMADPRRNPLLFIAQDTLKQTLESLGATVVCGDVHHAHEQCPRSMYVRDTAVSLPVGATMHLLHSSRESLRMRDDSAHGRFAEAARQNPLPMEMESLARLQDFQHFEALGKLQTHPIDGVVDGGNAVFDPAQRILYVGHNHHFAADYNLPAFSNAYDKSRLSRDYVAKLGAGRHLPENRALVNEEIGYSYPYRLGFEGIDAQVARINARLPEGEQKIRVVRLFIPNEKAVERDEGGNHFYHLDGCLGILPSGQAVVCMSALGKASQHQIRKYFPPEMRLEISEAEAKLGATNFITVGNHIVTPYASPAMQDFYAKAGYETKTQASHPLDRKPEWLTGPMASVRCLTLKLSEDKGFPAIPCAGQQRG